MYAAPKHTHLVRTLRAPACTPCLASHTQNTAHAVRSWSRAVSPATRLPARAVPVPLSHLPALPRARPAPSDRPSAHFPRPLPPHAAPSLRDGRPTGSRVAVTGGERQCEPSAADGASLAPRGGSAVQVCRRLTAPHTRQPRARLPTAARSRLRRLDAHLPHRAETTRPRWAPLPALATTPLPATGAPRARSAPSMRASVGWPKAAVSLAFTARSHKKMYVTY